MRPVLITGHEGFIGRNLWSHLGRRDDIEVLGFGRGSSSGDLGRALADVAVVVHLAGVNRPEHEQEFETENVGLTERICDTLARRSQPPRLIHASSTQATLDNPYGRSKRGAEEVLTDYAERANSEVVIFRLPNVFGKWCRPNYNSVVATFCHNVAHDLPIRIDNADADVGLVYIDDVVDSFERAIDAPPFGPGTRFVDPPSGTSISVGELARRIRSFHEYEPSRPLPDLSDPFDKQLYATFLSYRRDQDLPRELDRRTDDRGELAEFLRGPSVGQIFVSRTRPGVTRGDHFHRTKTEKFLVLEGEALIRLRTLEDGLVRKVRVSGWRWTVVDIPPGVTHSITNVGESDLVTLFWASEPFDPDRPDTWSEPV